jgi:hypothetical protein
VQAGERILGADATAPVGFGVHARLAQTLLTEHLPEQPGRGVKMV